MDAGASSPGDVPEFTLEQLKEALGDEDVDASLQAFTGVADVGLPGGQPHFPQQGDDGANGAHALAQRRSGSGRGSPLTTEEARASPGVLAVSEALGLLEWRSVLERTGFDHAIERMARAAAWGVTVFAPVGSALSRALQGPGAPPPSDEVLREMLRAHVAVGVLPASQLRATGLVQTDSGQCHAIHSDAPAVADAVAAADAAAPDAAAAFTVAGVRVVRADVPICGGMGVMHLVEEMVPCLRLTQPPRKEQVWNKTVRPQPRLAVAGSFSPAVDVLRVELRHADTDTPIDRALRGHLVALRDTSRERGRPSGGRSGPSFAAGVASLADLVIVQKPPEVPKKKRGRGDEGAGGGAGPGGRYRLVYALVRTGPAAAMVGRQGSNGTPAGGGAAASWSAAGMESARMPMPVGQGQPAASPGDASPGAPCCGVMGDSSPGVAALAGAGPAPGAEGTVLTFLDPGLETVLRNSFHMLSEAEKQLRRTEYRLTGSGAAGGGQAQALHQAGVHTAHAPGPDHLGTSPAGQHPGGIMSPFVDARASSESLAAWAQAGLTPSPGAQASGGVSPILPPLVEGTRVAVDPAVQGTHALGAAATPPPAAPPTTPGSEHGPSSAPHAVGAVVARKAPRPVLLDMCAKSGRYTEQTRVWVQGRNLNRDTQIYFGREQAAAAEVVSATLIKATAPPQWHIFANAPPDQTSASVRVCASNDGGSSFSSALEFVYTRPPPVPALPLGNISQGPASPTRDSLDALAMDLVSPRGLFPALRSPNLRAALLATGHSGSIKEEGAGGEDDATMHLSPPRTPRQGGGAATEARDTLQVRTPSMGPSDLAQRLAAAEAAAGRTATPGNGGSAVSSLEGALQALLLADHVCAGSASLPPLDSLLSLAARFEAFLTLHDSASAGRAGAGCGANGSRTHQVQGHPNVSSRRSSDTPALSLDLSVSDVQAHLALIRSVVRLGELAGGVAAECNHGGAVATPRRTGGGQGSCGGRDAHGSSADRGPASAFSIAQERHRSEAMLASFLLQRPSMADLRAHGVLRGDDDEPVSLNAVAEFLNVFLSRRPSPAQVAERAPTRLERGGSRQEELRRTLEPLLQSRPSHQEAQAMLGIPGRFETDKTRSILNAFLERRPSIDDLRSHNILRTDLLQDAQELAAAATSHAHTRAALEAALRRRPTPEQMAEQFGAQSNAAPPTGADQLAADRSVRRSNGGGRASSSHLDLPSSGDEADEGGDQAGALPSDLAQQQHLHKGRAPHHLVRTPSDDPMGATAAAPDGAGQSQNSHGRPRPPQAPHQAPHQAGRPAAAVELESELETILFGSGAEGQPASPATALGGGSLHGSRNGSQTEAARVANGAGTDAFSAAELDALIGEVMLQGGSPRAAAAAAASVSADGASAGAMSIAQQHQQQQQQQHTIAAHGGGDDVDMRDSS